MLLLITGMICICERVGWGSGVAGFGMVVCLAGYLMGQRGEGSIYGDCLHCVLVFVCIVFSFSFPRDG